MKHTVLLLLFSSSPDHVYEWRTVTDLFQTEATSCTKYVILLLQFWVQWAAGCGSQCR